MHDVSIQAYGLWSMVLINAPVFCFILTLVVKSRQF